MSGYLGFAGNVVSQLSSSAPLIIGGLVLEGHEVPGRISIGGAQAVTIHKMPGGARIIDAMGADAGAIAWRGVFVGPGAAQKARSVDLMRQQGMPQVLSFGDYTFSVVIVHFEYDYQDQGAVIAYRIRTEMVPASDAASNSSTLDFAVQDDLSTAQTILEAGATVASSYAALAAGRSGTSISAAAVTVASLSTTFATISTTAASAALDASAGCAATQGNLAAAAVTLSTAIDAVSGGDLSAPASGLSFASASALAVSTGQAAALAALVRASGCVNRTNSNIASANAQMLAPLVHA